MRNLLFFKKSYRSKRQCYQGQWRAQLSAASQYVLAGEVRGIRGDRFGIKKDEEYLLKWQFTATMVLSQSWRNVDEI